MTRTISLIIGIATVALTVAAPTAFGRGQPVGSPEQQAVAPDWFERAAIAAQRNSQVYVDAADRVVEPQSIVALRARSEALNKTHRLGEFAVPYRDAADRVVQPQSLKALTARSEGLNRMYGLGEFAGDTGYVDASERAVPPVGTPVTVSATGNEVEWPKIGIGFGLGLALILGLVLTLKATHSRPFAH